MKSSLLLFFVFSFSSLMAQEILPPVQPWSGASESLVVPKSHKWITPFELSDLQESPDYETTMAWLKKLDEASPLLTIVEIGKSEQNRAILMVIASKNKQFDAKALQKTNKPLLLIQAGIHAGEIDGKDAGMMLLRDIAFGNKSALLDQVNIAFIPILNVDGHERRSAFGRVNQRGPKEMGWRTNARNLNLNRDYTKLETAGIQAVVNIINTYKPSLYLDIHVTDGADYQYDITYGFVNSGGHSPQISKWLSQVYRPQVDKALEKMGHIPGPLLFARNGEDFSSGNIEYAFGPRFSHTYGDSRHLPTILVENHSLKPFSQRVLGTYVFLEQSIRTLGEAYQTVKNAIDVDSRLRPDSVAVAYGLSEQKPDTLAFKGIRFEKKTSEITKETYVQWTGEPIAEQVVNYKMDRPTKWVKKPKAYWISSEWKSVIEKLKQHGVEMEIIPQKQTKSVEWDYITSIKLASDANEGRVRVNQFSVKPVTKSVEFPAGSVRITTNQALGELVSILLEPQSADSFFQWGFFLEVLTQTEYMETYVMEPMIEKMLQENAGLKAQFDEKMKTDSVFANSPRSIFRWFYEKTPYFDAQWNRIPVAREW